ncbi:phosphatase PAP2 family protein [Skermanella mucosa]|uniref:phosphatase PAP2 family protein n=1 Tax=Skermanella mucosa TaxID=1789672 RepID=UPI00192B0233|nr:phosphatase PAP2 family protein [Skermanella mucosa]UEM20758.1 phosphatase PAP2 family protein [Skermanella mucosa]
MMHTVTSLGDSGLLLPASVCVFAYLLWRGAPSVALLWAATLAVGLGTTLVAKLGFIACGSSVGLAALESPSGHTSFAAIFFGCCALIAGFGRPAWQRLAILAVAGTVILLVAVSRVALRAHTAEEVVGGLAIGCACVGLFAWAHARIDPPAVRLRPVAVVFAVLVVLLNGHSLSAEPLIRDIAHKLRITMDVCG